MLQVPAAKLHFQALILYFGVDVTHRSFRIVQENPQISPLCKQYIFTRHFKVLVRGLNRERNFVANKIILNFLFDAVKFVKDEVLYSIRYDSKYFFYLINIFYYLEFPIKEMYDLFSDILLIDMLNQQQCHLYF